LNIAICNFKNQIRNYVALTIQIIGMSSVRQKSDATLSYVVKFNYYYFLKLNCHRYLHLYVTVSLSDVCVSAL